MADETMRRFGSARTIAATPLAVAILALSCAMPAEAGWLARGTGVAGAGYALKENLDDLVDRFGEMADAAVSGDSAKEPLPVAVVSGARIAPAPQAKADPWGAAPTAAAARSPDPGGVTGGGAADSAAIGYVWNAEGTGVVALPSDWRDPKGTATAAADPDDAYAAALDAALGDDPTTGSGDYRAALGALETREAERQEAERVAAARREAERREAERVAAARREAERREAERVAAAERREAERQMRRDAEDARRRQEQFVNSIQQTVNTMQQTLQTLQGSGTSQPSGRGSSYAPKKRYCPGGIDPSTGASCGSH